MIKMNIAEIEVGDSVKRTDLKDGEINYEVELEIININEKGFYYYKPINGMNEGHNSYLDNLRLIKKRITKDTESFLKEFVLEKNRNQARQQLKVLLQENKRVCKVKNMDGDK